MLQNISIYHFWPILIMLKMLSEVIKKTSKNKNSMLQDILHQRQTEIDFLNGKIVNLGEKFRNLRQSTK